MRILGGKGVLMLALLLGLATSYVSWRYVQDSAETASPVSLVPVLVAVQPIPQRTIITPQMVQVKQLPADARAPSAYAEASQVVGRVSRTELAPGEHLLPHQFFLQREKSGLAFMIPESRRAIAVAVSELIGSGGMIVPGDRVDVYALFDYKNAQDANASAAGSPASGRPGEGERLPEKNTVIALVLQHVEVLAVAQNVEGEDTRGTSEQLAQRVEGKPSNSVPQAKASVQPQARTVTLAVTPLEAEKLILAEERGKIRLALRPASEQGRIDIPPLELKQVLAAPTE